MLILLSMPLNAPEHLGCISLYFFGKLIFIYFFHRNIYKLGIQYSRLSAIRISNKLKNKFVNILSGIRLSEKQPRSPIKVLAKLVVIFIP